MSTKFAKFDKVQRILERLAERASRSMHDADLYRDLGFSSLQEYGDLRDEMIGAGWINPPVFGEEEITPLGLEVLREIHDGKCPFEYRSADWGRWYWRHLTDEELREYQVHYTTGTGKGLFPGVSEGMSFEDYCLETALQTEFERIHDI